VIFVEKAPRSKKYCSEKYIEENECCWSDVNVFTDNTPKKKSVVLKDNQGLIIPSGSWHAVINNKHTIAIGIVVHHD